MAVHVERLGGMHVAPGPLKRVLRQLRDDSRTAAHGMQPPPMARHERLLLTERDQAGTPVVATTLALYHRSDPVGAGGWHRMPWEELGRVRWDRLNRRLEVTRYPGGPSRTLRLRLAVTSRVPDVIRDRVGATELGGLPVALGNGTTATVAARRRPITSEIIWVVMLPDGCSPNDPGTRDVVSAAMRELRVQLGLH